MKYATLTDNDNKALRDLIAAAVAKTGLTSRQFFLAMEYRGRGEMGHWYSHANGTTAWSPVYLRHLMNAGLLKTVAITADGSKITTVTVDKAAKIIAEMVTEAREAKAAKVAI